MSKRQSRRAQVEELDFDNLFKNFTKPYLNPSLAKTESDKLNEVNKIEGDLKKEMGNLGAKEYATNCPKCGKTIGKNDEMIQAIGFRYHPRCFTCETCNKMLGETPFLEQGGKIYCPADHAKLFSSKCAGCGEVITNSVVHALGKTWHENHLKCSHCGNVVGTGFVEKDGKAYCRHDYVQLFLAVCGSCSLPIEGSYFQALDRKWHEKCYNCQTCHKPFDGTAYPFNNLPYCERHFHEKNKSICTRCSSPINGQCIKALDRSFHPNCFTCHVCHVKLGAEYYDVDGHPHCATHGEYE